MKNRFINLVLFVSLIATMAGCSSQAETPNVNQSETTGISSKSTGITLPGEVITDWHERYENIMATTFATREQIANVPAQTSNNPVVTMAEQIPEEYLNEAGQQGKIIEISYQAPDRAGDGKTIEKVADVYLPYGYETDTEKQYDSIYLVHGWTGTSDVYFAHEDGKNDLKVLLDNMIEKGDIAPALVITPTWDRDNKGKELEESISEMSVFYEELENELVPYIDEHFRTIADRNHRAATGFSLGAASTWYTFLNSMDLFRWYLPASGNCFVIEERSDDPEVNAKTAEYLVNYLKDSNISPKDYFIYSIAGTKDVAFRLNESLNNQLVNYPEYFNESNFIYQLNEGGIHWWDSIQVDFYNALPIFFENNKTGGMEGFQAVGDNPFGLVYDGAITENEPGKVNIHAVHYISSGVRIAANVYTPAGYDENGSALYPAVTVAHPNGGVKEQVSGLFAQKLAENGYIAIAADAAYQGASAGVPRNLDIPGNRVEDVHSMVDFISTYPGVDPERIGMLGICGGGGYTIKAAQTEKRAKAVATLSMFNTGIVRLYGLGNSQADTVQERLEEAIDARDKEVRGEGVQYPPARGEMTREQVDAMPPGLYRDGIYYYGMDYAHPNSGGQVPVKCLIDLVDFDARHNMELITQPLLMMAGSEADTLYMTEDCYELATGTEDKELFLIDGARHIQTYFVPEYVEQEVSKLLEFFGEKL